MLKELLRPEIQELVTQKDWRNLKETLSNWPAQDIADLLKSIEQEDIVILFRLLPRQIAADVFDELDGEDNSEAPEYTAIRDSQRVPEIARVSRRQCRATNDTRLYRHSSPLDY